MALSILILTGQSGSGKSTALRALEDEGYFCVDNMPTCLVEQVIDAMDREHTTERLVLAMDIRERHFVQQAPALVARLRSGPHPLRVIYLDAKEDVVIRRYSETRRSHPLDCGRGLRTAIEEERVALAPLRELADETLDTSNMSPHALRAHVSERVAGVEPGDAIRVGLLSFGFKYGVPLEADMVLDVRFLTNPYFDARYRPLTGLDADVAQFVLDNAYAKKFLQMTSDFLYFLVPQYQREGKRYFTVAIGCTGGRHRSVAIACALAERLALQSIKAELRHRDLKEDTL